MRTSFFHVFKKEGGLVSACLHTFYAPMRNFCFPAAGRRRFWFIHRLYRLFFLCPLFILPHTDILLLHHLFFRCRYLTCLTLLPAHANTQQHLLTRANTIPTPTVSVSRVSSCISSRGPLDGRHGVKRPFNPSGFNPLCLRASMQSPL